MISLLALSPAKIEKAFWVLLGIAALVTFIVLLEGRWILKFVPLSVSGLSKIGVVRSIKGHAFRKLKNDSLHLPLNMNDLVYEDDLVTTDEDSTLEILLIDQKNSRNTLLQEPNTILRLSHDRGSLLIQLHSGGVSTQFTDDTMVKVQAGTMTKEIQIRKGTYLIKNSSMGIQIAAFDSSIAVKKTISESDEPRKAHKTAINEEASEEKMTETSGDENVDRSKFKMPMRLPYPPEHQVFLLTDDSVKKLVLVAKKTCEGDCHLQVACGKSILYGKELPSGSIPLYGLDLKKGASCSEYSWKFSDDKDNFERGFVVEPYTDEVFQKHLNLGEPIEML